MDKHLGLLCGPVAWYYETSTVTGEDSNGNNIVRRELRGRLPFQTTRDLDVILLLSINEHPVTYDIRTRVKRYGDHQFNIDAGTEPEKALPIVQGTTLRGHFLPGRIFLPPNPLEPGVEQEFGQAFGSTLRPRCLAC